jgi:predicted metal-binding protein
LHVEDITVKPIEHLLLQNREQLKIHEYAFLFSKQVTFSDEVRRLCERNACGMYGKSWACPPSVGSVEDCKAKCRVFHHALIFTSLSTLRKKHDIRGWQGARIRHETINESVVSIVRSQFDKMLALSTEGCMVCENCTYPNQPCRFPKRMFPATEGFGINVLELAKTCGITYYNGPNTVTYFSILFF